MSLEAIAPAPVGGRSPAATGATPSIIVQLTSGERR